MALIKTDSQNYSNIANAIRELTGGKTIFDMDITTALKDDGDIMFSNSEIKCFIDNVQNRVGEIFVVEYDNVEYLCELRKYSEKDVIGNVTLSFDYYYLGNLSLNSLLSSATNSYPDTGEIFCIFFMYWAGILGVANFHTTQAGTHHFTVVKKYYKPEEMKLILDENIPDYGVSFNSDGTVATTYGSKVAGFTYNTKITTVNISERALEICDRAFEYTNLTSITLPNNIRRIGQWAFFGSSKLENINMPNNFKKIDNYGFYKTKLKSVVLPSTLEDIGFLSFADCSDLESFTFKAKPKTIVYNTIFDSCPKLTTINVPWSKGEVEGAPWGATNATVNYNWTGV